MNSERKPIGINHLTVKPRNSNLENDTNEINGHRHSEEADKDAEDSKK